ncbi:hypothetical protein IWW51_004448, partial [Coemansia sp. RSA 2702]
IPPPAAPDNPAANQLILTMGRGKYTTQEALDAQPEPTPICPVVRVLGPRGQHLHEVAVASSLVSADVNRHLNPDARPWFTTLAQLPPKFRSVLWVRRGSHVLVDLSESLTDKIGGEVVMVLLPAQIKQLKQAGQWPAQYDQLWPEIAGHTAASQPAADAATAESDSEESADDLLLRGNPNRRVVNDESSDDRSSDDPSDDESD